VGPSDELQITVYGVQNLVPAVQFSVEGKISIQNVGEISVSGMKIEAATKKIESAIASIQYGILVVNHR
jgi:protein involved in polysaccharide export with SLBB domain